MSSGGGASVEFSSRDSRVSWKSLHFVRSRSGATPYGCGVAVDQLNPLRALNFIEKVLGILLLASTSRTSTDGTSTG